MKPAHITSREDEALAEIAATVVSRQAGWGLTISFLLFITLVPLVQQIRSLLVAPEHQKAMLWQPSFPLWASARTAHQTFREQGTSLHSLLAANKPVLQSLHDFETSLADDSWLSAWLLNPVQRFLVRYAGAATESVYPGKDDWLFFRPSFDYLTGPRFDAPAVQLRRQRGGHAWEPPVHPDSLPVIIDFHRYLAARGIKLLLVPAPPKLAIEPNHFSTGQEPLHNPAYTDWLNALRDQQISVLDTGAFLAALPQRPLYLTTDTHWLPSTVISVASWISDHIDAFNVLEDDGYAAWTHIDGEVEGRGDLEAMIAPPGTPPLGPPQRVSLREVRGNYGDTWRPSDSSQVLLMGDSFTNIYSQPELGWGANAGLAEQLSFFLRRPIDLLARNDAGAHATREMLARELAAGRDRLEGKKVVVWQFAERELAVGDWRPVSFVTLPRTTPPPPLGDIPEYLAVSTGQPIEVVGNVRAASSVPRPLEVPYADHLRSVLIEEPRTTDGRLLARFALVYTLSMKERTLTPAASWRPGTSIRVKISSWNDVSSTLARINRSELDDDALLLVDPAYAEPL